jgi:hypothetical protein
LAVAPRRLRRLNHKQIIALSGNFRRRAIAKLADDPGRDMVRLLELSSNWEEAVSILEAALGYSAAVDKLAETASPWLCALTGARMGEMLQLRRYPAGGGALDNNNLPRPAR